MAPGDRAEVAAPDPGAGRDRPARPRRTRGRGACARGCRERSRSARRLPTSSPRQPCSASSSPPCTNPRPTTRRSIGFAVCRCEIGPRSCTSASFSSATRSTLPRCWPRGSCSSRPRRGRVRRCGCTATCTRPTCSCTTGGSPRSSTSATSRAATARPTLIRPLDRRGMLFRRRFARRTTRSRRDAAAGNADDDTWARAAVLGRCTVRDAVRRRFRQRARPTTRDVRGPGGRSNEVDSPDSSAGQSRRSAGHAAGPLVVVGAAVQPQPAPAESGIDQAHDRAGLDRGRLLGQGDAPMPQVWRESPRLGEISCGA